MNEAAVAWLREAVRERKALAEAAAQADGGFHPAWTAALGGGFLTDADDPDYAITVETLDEIAAHMAANDPRQVIAACEADLTILDEHYILSSAKRRIELGLELSERFEGYSVVRCGKPGGFGDREMGCVTCHYYAMGGVRGFGVCRTVRAVASRYEYSPGYAECWPPVNY